MNKKLLSGVQPQPGLAQSIDFQLSKVSTTNTDAVQKSFLTFMSKLQSEIEINFKNYNRFIAEPRNKIDVQIKATKKEKMRHNAFYARQELKFWENFPRNKKFYYQGLSEIQTLMTQDQFNYDEVRDVDQLILNLMEVLPTCSQKYCKMFDIEQNKKLYSAQQLITFDKITENIRTFDSKDVQNWQILAYSVTLLVSDVISTILDPSTKGAPLFCSQETTQAILKQAKFYCKIPARIEEDENYEGTQQKELYEQIQISWSRQIFQYLSMVGRQNFDSCLKFLQLSLNNDHRKFEEQKIDEFCDQIYFCRFLNITPTDMEMGAKVLNLLDTFLQMLQQKSKQSFKECLLSSLRHLLQYLWFNENFTTPSFDNEAMKIQWVCIQKIFQVTDALQQKKEGLRELCYLLMATILKIAPDDFIEQNLQKFLTTIKFNSFFQPNKDKQKDPSKELKLLCQLLVPGYLSQSWEKAWQPKTTKIDIFFKEKGTKIYTPVQFEHTNFNQITLKKRYCDQFLLPNIYKLFESIYSPKQQIPLEYCHWQLLLQLAYDDMDKIISVCLPHLFSFKNTESGVEFLVLGLQFCRHLLDPKYAFKQQYLLINKEVNDYEDKIKLVKEIAAKTVKEILYNGFHLKQNQFIQLCLNHFKLPSNLFLDNFNATTTIQNVRVSNVLAKHHRSNGKFYLQDKSRTVTFDDANELERLDFQYDDDNLNQTLADLSNCQYYDTSKEQFTRFRMVSHLAENSGEKQNLNYFTEISHYKQFSIELVVKLIELFPFLEMNDCMFFFPSYQTSLKGDLTEKAQQTLGHPCQNMSSETSFLSECERLLPVYYLLSLDFKIQLKAQKCIYKLMMNAPTQIKFAIIDQICYMLKEFSLIGDEKHYKNLIYILMNSIHIWLWTERSRFSTSQQVNNEVEFEASEIKYIYCYLHIFKLVDTFAITSLCNKDVSIRQTGTILIADIAKLKRLLVKKELWSPLFDDIFYQNQTKVLKIVNHKITIINSMRNMQGISPEVFETLGFYNFMIDNFEYQKFGLNEPQVRDLQVVWLGELLKLYKQEMLKDFKSDLRRDINGSLLMNLLSVLTQRLLQQFENIRSGENAEAQHNSIGFNLIYAFLISNITRSHQRLNKQVPIVKQEQISDQYEEILTSGDSISTNTLQEEAKVFLGMIETNLHQVHKIPFNKFYPPRIWTSNILLSFIYYLQEDVLSQQKSLDNLNEVFLMQRVHFDQKNDYATNSVVFQSLLSCETIMQKYVEIYPQHLKQFISTFQILQNFEMQDDPQLTKTSILRINVIHSCCTIIKALGNKQNLLQIFDQKIQNEVFKETREQIKVFEKSEKLNWLCPLIKKIWYCIIGLQSTQDSSTLDLDLKFLIQLEQEGFQGCLNAFNSQKVSIRQNQAQESKRINDIKILIQYVYAFNAQTAKDTSGILYQVPTQLIQKNIYFKCLTSIIDTSQVRQMLEVSTFDEIQNLISKQLIGTRFNKLVKAGLHTKLFLVCLFITLNAVDKQFIEKARIICLAVLPSMFSDKTYEKNVQIEIKQQELSNLIHFESKHFFSFVKRVFKGEEQFNMQNHFEKYFSLSGFLRDLLNEIIKIQSTQDGPAVQPRMLLRVLDMITYFFSGISLRRSPITDEGSFIFAHLIDYKSFEFLSKLYKISEKLVDYDTENMTVMNMWFKVCEGRESNFDVLAKFLIHNLSSFVMKVMTNKNDDQVNFTSEIELEKHKRYSLSIFNYIKARTQQIDVRNSLNINSVTWSQKMLKVVLKAQLNIMSKYTLEKIKLKKVLEILHAEINQSGLKLQLKGGLDTLNPIKRGEDVRNSVSMSQLLKSQTFLNTFSQRRADEKTNLSQLIFVLERQMKDRFYEFTPEVQIQKTPDLVIRYFENTLILIANESERLQIIKFTQKEELVVTSLILVLVGDMVMRRNQSDSNRAYFLYDLLYKLTLNISGIQKYIKSISIEQFCLLKNEQDILNLFNSRQTFDIFPRFTTIYFKLLGNLINNPRLYRLLAQIWQMTLIKHQQLTSKDQIAVALYERSQVKTLSKVSFMIAHELSKRNDPTVHNNLVLTTECLLDMIVPTQKNQIAFKDFSDKQSSIIAFSTNVLYWISFSFLQDSEFQQIGAQILRRIMEESEFYKEVLGLLQVQQNFKNFKLPHVNKSLLEMLFGAVENARASQDVFKCILVTIKAQDSQLVSNAGQQARDEIHRLLILIPFLLNQFTIQDVTQSIAVFTNKRSVIQLLKKSLPSISISTKKEILQILDFIQREVDQDDLALIKEQFLNLIEEVQKQLQQQEFGEQVLQSVTMTLKSMQKNKVDSVRRDVIEICLQKIQIDKKEVKEREYITWPNECLGQEVAFIPENLKMVYFSLKHICLQEIELQGLNIDCKSYFCGADSQNQHQKQGTQRANNNDIKLEKQTSVDLDPASQLKSLNVRRTSGVFTKKQEIISKYQNSGNQSYAKPTLEFQPVQQKLQIYDDNSSPKVELKGPQTIEQITKIEASPELKPFIDKEGETGLFGSPKNQQIEQIIPQTQGSNLVGTFSVPKFENELNPHSMQISQQISSISLKQTNRQNIVAGMIDDRANEIFDARSEVDRPQTGQFIENEFDFAVEHPGYQFRSTQPVQMNPNTSQLQEFQKPKINKYVESEHNGSFKSATNESVRERLGNIDKQIKLIAADDNLLYELEQFMEQQNYDIDNLAFYLKAIDFKQEKQNRNIVAGLILDNYLSEDAEFYIGGQFSNDLINQIISNFRNAIETDQVVEANLFSKCTEQMKQEGLESLIQRFMNL